MPNPAFHLNQAVKAQKANQDFSRALEQLKTINTAAYENGNSAMDLETVPELSIPTMEAPNQQLLTNNEARTNYRTRHFHIVHVDREAGGLIARLERDLAAVAGSIAATRSADLLAIAEEDKKK